MKIRLIAALVAAKLVYGLIRLLKRGKGSSLPGRVALKICPDLPRYGASRVKRGIIMVTGTNGKTTTNNMIAGILEGSGYRVLINREGANLVAGITTAFIRGMDVLGRLDAEWACLEVDEAAFPRITGMIRPDYVVITNFFRDQLDRYGELDTTVAMVKKSLAEMEGTRLVLNADDPLVAQMGRISGLPAVYYGLGDHQGATRKASAAREAKYCPFCGFELKYRFYHYSQLGDYSCPGCGFHRPEPDVKGSNPRSEGTAASCRAVFHQGSGLDLKIPLYGLYNLYNALAAFSLAVLLGVAQDRAAVLLSGYRTATGRMEKFNYRGRPVFLNLVKNPTGFNEGLAALLNLPFNTTDVVMALNDNDADGRDISWVWDVDFEMLEGRDRFGMFVCTGQRGEEMALRLKYAGIDTGKILVRPDMDAAVETLLAGSGGVSYILATYTALWPLERILSGYAQREAQAEYLPHVS